MTGKLNETEINNLLSSQSLGRIACTDGRQPYIVPVTYFYNGKYIFGQSNEGAKLKILRNNPRVCFETDRMLDMRNWQSVLVYGKFEELKNEESDNARDLLFGHVYSLATSSTVHTHEHEAGGKVNDSNRVKSVMYRIKIKKITGRFEK